MNKAHWSVLLSFDCIHSYSTIGVKTKNDIAFLCTTFVYYEYILTIILPYVIVRLFSWYVFNSTKYSIYLLKK